MSSVETYLHDYLQSYTDYKSYWNYEDGCVLIGCIQMYKATGDAFYRDFVMNYLQRRVAPDGSIPTYETEQYNIDSINCGKALFFALDETGDPRYRKAIEYVMDRLRAHPRCECGSFWHKTLYPNQIWLDGLYMAQPFYMEYEMRFGGFEHIRDIIAQFSTVRQMLYNEHKHLYYHAYDESRQQPWCDKQSGCSHNFWLRSMGWFVMALSDCAALVDEQLYDSYKTLEGLLQEAIHGLLDYRAADGLFYQVIDHPEVVGNYTETSGSAMIAYALLKGSQIGALNAEKYQPIGSSIVEALIKKKLRTTDEGTHLCDICAVAGLGPGEKRDGSIAYYLSEPIVSDDAKGVGPFMMAYARYLKHKRGEQL